MTFLSLAKAGKVSEIFRSSARHLLRVERHHFAELDLTTFAPGRFKARIPLDYRLASAEDMDSLFESWPDSREEYERHHEVYHTWGLRNCFLFSHKLTGEIVHFQFLLTSEDLPNMKRFLPMQIYGALKSTQDAFVEWTYTFQKYRWRGIAIEAMERVLGYCRENGIRKVFSHMSETNTDSVKLCQRIGFSHTATFYQLRFPRQNKHAGIYFKRKLKPTEQTANRARDAKSHT
jgi:RimJ/RimL family protein N-acetyltransferase